MFLSFTFIHCKRFDFAERVCSTITSRTTGFLASAPEASATVKLPVARRIAKGRAPGSGVACLISSVSVTALRKRN